MELLSIVFGIVLTILIYYMVEMVLREHSKVSMISLDDPTDDVDYVKHFKDTPHCPFCNSYNLKLVDDNANVPWLKGHIPELDHFQCMKCYETFSDEDWKTIKVYHDQPHDD
jgi:hypothetical protein